MMLAFISLVAGLWSGLLRIGVPLPALAPDLATSHGPLMIGGFLGTLISLERAVALGRPWAYGAPLLAGIGTALGLLSGPGHLAPIVVTAGSLLFVASSLDVMRRQFTDFTTTMALGAASWAIGNGLWSLGRPVFELVVWWMAFPLLTILGERLELSRVIRPPKIAQRTFAFLVAVEIAGAGIVSLSPALGSRILGLTFVAFAAWLSAFDVVKRTIKTQGLTRYIAACLLTGYVWLGVSGALWLWLGAVRVGPLYDAVLHTFFVGFVFSMIFGHAPIILPAVLRVEIKYRVVFYLPLALLHLALVLRVIGDLAPHGELRVCGGVLNAVAVVLFFATMAIGAAASRR
ncbi:MAG: hypothetical protein H6685_07520 [Deltaproteobacteria bacterium]|nr:hypothetical protein [Deltaproteobacteria bacterium]